MKPPKEIAAELAREITTADFMHREPGLTLERFVEQALVKFGRECFEAAKLAVRINCSLGDLDAACIDTAARALFGEDKTK